MNVTMSSGKNEYLNAGQLDVSGSSHTASRFIFVIVHIVAFLTHLLHR